MNVTPLLALAGLGTIGLLATRLPRLPWPQGWSVHRLLAAGGLFALAGLVLGPGIDLLTRPVLDALAPVTTLAIGWIGAALGAQFEWRYVRRIPRVTWLMTGLSAAAAFAGVLIGAGLLVRTVPALSAAWTPRLPALLTLAAALVASGSGAVAGLARAAGASRGVVRCLERMAPLHTAIGALAFSVAVALAHPHPLYAWTVAGVGGGALTGAVFLVLTRLAAEPAETGFALLATVLVGAGLGNAAGAAAFVVCAVATGFAVNASPSRRLIRSVLGDWQCQMGWIILVAAGALLALPTPWLLVAVLVLVGLRAAGAGLATWAGSRLPLNGVARFPAHIGLGTTAPAVAAVALALNFVTVLGDRAAGGGGPLLTTVLLAVAVTQVAAPTLMRRALGASPAAGTR